MATEPKEPKEANPVACLDDVSSFLSQSYMRTNMAYMDAIWDGLPSSLIDSLDNLKRSIQLVRADTATLRAKIQRENLKPK